MTDRPPSTEPRTEPPPAPLQQELDRLRASDRVFRAVLDHAPVLISTKDLQGTVLMANRHFDILDGYDPDKFIGANIFDLFPREIAEQLWRNDRRAALEKRAVHEEESVYHRDKTLHTYVDRFKQYNDTYGHPQGDQVLKAVADTMRRSLNRPGDLCFRIGGDEFACLFASAGPDESTALAEQIRAGVAARLIAHAGNPPGGHVTLSLGLAFIDPDSTLGQGAIYELADQALYRAKHKGRNTVSR